MHGKQAQISGLGLVAACLGISVLLLYQLGILTFVTVSDAPSGIAWRLVYYGYWGTLLAITAAFLLLRQDVRRATFPIAIYCVIAVGLALLHPLDGISKNFLVAMGSFLCVAVLAAGSAPRRLLAVSAAVTAVAAAICLLDIMTINSGLTGFAGRAAGFAINPNVAAAALLIGAAATYPVLHGTLRDAFVMLIFAAIAVTLSRSVLLAAAIMGGITAMVFATRWYRSGHVFAVDWARLAKLGFITAWLLAWIGVAWIHNPRFSVSAYNAYSGLFTATATFLAERAPEGSLAKPAPTPTRVAAPQSTASTTKASARFVRQIEEEGHRNSASARGLLLERSVRLYLSGPLLGRGLAEAHANSPHNSFLLFAVAFGHLGLVIPIGFLVLTAYGARRWEDAALPCAVGLILVASHDIMLSPGFLAPIALSLAARFTARNEAVASTNPSPVLAGG